MLKKTRSNSLGGLRERMSFFSDEEDLKDIEDIKDLNINNPSCNAIKKVLSINLITLNFKNKFTKCDVYYK